MGGLMSYFRGLFGNREMRILILGLDGAGKTTLLYRLQVGEVVTTIPTIGFNVEQVSFMHITYPKVGLQYFQGRAQRQQ